MHIAILGATGAVGRTMLDVLEERNFPLDQVTLLASERSAGSTLEWRGRQYTLKAPAPGVFRGVDIALFSAGGARSLEWGPRAADEGAVVVDNSSAWRMDPDCPLVVPEVNADQLHHIKKGIVANPNCVAIPLCVALKPLHDLGRIKRIIVSTYQSSSGKGAKGLADFETQLKAFAAGGPVPAPTSHRAQLAGNVITLDWTLDPNGYTEEENKVVNETRKILGDATIGVSTTCVRVPVKVSHSESVNVEFFNPVSAAEAKAALAKAPGVVLMDEARGDCPQPLHAEGSDHTFVGRVRQDPSNLNALNLWVVADNLRKGAASNAVQCAEELVKRGIVK
jgi:aspartate-semialdehyde dehydrogenase